MGVLGRLGASWGVLGCLRASWGRLGGVLEASWEHLGRLRRLEVSWGAVWEGVLGRVLGRFWGAVEVLEGLGASWERHGASWWSSWGRLGTFLGVLEMSWGVLGPPGFILGVSLGVLKVSWGVLKHIIRMPSRAVLALTTNRARR